MTKYQKRLNKRADKKLEKEEKKIKKQEKKKVKKENKLFKKLNRATYGWFKQNIVKILHLASPIVGYGLFGYWAYKNLWTRFILELTPSAKMSLGLNSISLAIGAALTISGIYLFIKFGKKFWKYIKRRELATDVASNIGTSSKRYSALITETFKGLIGAWIFALIYGVDWVFNQYYTLSTVYIKAFTVDFNGIFTETVIAGAKIYGIAMIIKLIATIYEQSAMRIAEKRQRKAEMNHKQMVKDIHSELDV